MAKHSLEDIRRQQLERDRAAAVSKISEAQGATATAAPPAPRRGGKISLDEAYGRPAARTPAGKISLESIRAQQIERDQAAATSKIGEPVAAPAPAPGKISLESVQAQQAAAQAPATPAVPQAAPVGVTTPVTAPVTAPSTVGGIPTATVKTDPRESETERQRLQQAVISGFATPESRARLSELNAAHEADAAARGRVDDETDAHHRQGLATNAQAIAQGQPAPAPTPQPLSQERAAIEAQEEVDLGPEPAAVRESNRKAQERTAELRFDLQNLERQGDTAGVARVQAAIEQGEARYRATLLQTRTGGGGDVEQAKLQQLASRSPAQLAKAAGLEAEFAAGDATIEDVVGLIPVHGLLKTQQVRTGESPGFAAAGREGEREAEEERLVRNRAALRWRLYRHNADRVATEAARDAVYPSAQGQNEAQRLATINLDRDAVAQGEGDAGATARQTTFNDRRERHLEQLGVSTAQLEALGQTDGDPEADPFIQSLTGVSLPGLKQADRFLGELYSATSRGSNRVASSIIETVAGGTRTGGGLAARFKHISEQGDYRASDDIKAGILEGGARKLLNPRYYASLAGEQAPIIASTIVAGRLSGTAATKLLRGNLRAAGVSAQAAGVGAAYAQEAGSQIQEARDSLIEQGVNREEANRRARVEGLAYGTIASVLEYIPLAKFVRRAGPEGRKTLRQAVATGLGQALSEGGTESLQATAGQLAGIIGRGEDPSAREFFGAILEEGLAGFFVGGGLGVAEGRGQDTNQEQPNGQSQPRSTDPGVGNRPDDVRERVPQAGGEGRGAGPGAAAQSGQRQAGSVAGGQQLDPRDDPRRPEHLADAGQPGGASGGDLHPAGDPDPAAEVTSADEPNTPAVGSGDERLSGVGPVSGDSAGPDGPVEAGGVDGPAVPEPGARVRVASERASEPAAVVEDLSADGKLAFLSGRDKGVPIEQLLPAEDGEAVQSADANNDLHGAASGSGDSILVPDGEGLRGGDGPVGDRAAGGSDVEAAEITQGQEVAGQGRQAGEVASATAVPGLSDEDLALRPDEELLEAFAQIPSSHAGPDLNSESVSRGARATTTPIDETRAAAGLQDLQSNLRRFGNAPTVTVSRVTEPSPAIQEAQKVASILGGFHVVAYQTDGPGNQAVEAASTAAHPEAAYLHDAPGLETQHARSLAAHEVIHGIRRIDQALGDSLIEEVKKAAPRALSAARGRYARNAADGGVTVQDGVLDEEGVATLAQENEGELTASFLTDAGLEKITDAAGRDPGLITKILDVIDSGLSKLGLRARNPDGTRAEQIQIRAETARALLAIRSKISEFRDAPLEGQRSEGSLEGDATTNNDGLRAPSQRDTADATGSDVAGGGQGGGRSQGDAGRVGPSTREEVQAEGPQTRPGQDPDADGQRGPRLDGPQAQDVDPGTGSGREVAQGQDPRGAEGEAGGDRQALPPAADRGLGGDRQGATGSRGPADGARLRDPEADVAADREPAPSGEVAVGQVDADAGARGDQPGPAAGRVGRADVATQAIRDELGKLSLPKLLARARREGLRVTKDTTPEAAIDFITETATGQDVRSDPAPSNTHAPEQVRVAVTERLNTLPASQVINRASKQGFPLKGATKTKAIAYLAEKASSAARPSQVVGLKSRDETAAALAQEQGVDVSEITQAQVRDRVLSDDLSTRPTLELLKKAKRAGLQVTSKTKKPDVVAALVQRAAEKANTPRPAETGTQQFTVAATKRRLLDQTQDYIDLVDDSLVSDEEFSAASTDAGSLSEHISFGGKIPDDLRQSLEGRANLRNRLRANVPGASGDDLISVIGVDRYIQHLETQLSATGGARDVRKAIEIGSGFGDHNPPAALDAWILNHAEHLTLPRPEAIDPADVQPGDTFQLYEQDVEVVQDDQGTLRIEADNLSVPVEALGAIPADRGTFERSDRPHQSTAFAVADTAGVPDKSSEKIKAKAAKEWKEKGVESRFFKKWFNGSRVVDNDGKPKVVHHGTDRGGFANFDEYEIGTNTANASHAFYFTDDKSNSGTYHRGRDEGIEIEDSEDENGDSVEHEQSGIYSVYLSLKDVWEFDFEGRGWDGINQDGEYDDHETIPQIEEQAKQAGVDGVIIRNVIDEGRYGQGYSGPATTYIVFDPKAIKSADQNTGEFSSGTSDIRFSIKKSKGDSGKLQTLHNLSEANLIAADKLGGLASPSIAVVNADDNAFNSFGGITLIAPTELVESKEGFAADVYDRDIYSPRFPQIGWKKKAGKAKAFIDKHSDAFESAEDTRSAEDIVYGVESKPHPDHGSITSILSGSDGAKLAFLRESGVPFRIPKREAFSGPSFMKSAAMSEWASKSGIAKLEAAVGVDRDTDKGDAVLKAFESDAESAQRESYKNQGMSPKDIESLVEHDRERRAENANSRGVINISAMDRMIRQLKSLAAKDVELDHSKMRKRLEKKMTAARKKEFKAWVDNAAGEMLGNPYIVHGRSKLPLTLENAVEAMSSKSKLGGEGTMTFSPAKAGAVGAKKLESLQEIREAKSRLSGSKALAKESQDEAFAGLRDKLIAHYEYKDWRGNTDVFGALDGSMAAMAHYLKGARVNKSHSAMKRALHREGFTDVPSDVVSSAVDFAHEHIKDFPADYFEGKFDRGVKINEFSAAAVPKDTSKKALAILEKHGIPVKTYSSKKEGDRARAVKSAVREAEKSGARVRFAISSTPAKPLTRAAFHRKYMAHRLKSPGDLAGIIRDGFKGMTRINLLPAHDGGPPTNVIEKSYGPKKGQTFLLVPKDQQDTGGSGNSVARGFRPAPHEIIHVTEDYQDLYAAYTEAVSKAAKQWSEKGTDSPLFKKWFAGSKVVTRDGAPLIVHHGTREKFEVFEGGRGVRKGLHSQGIWFTPAQDEAADFYASEGGEVKSVYLNIKNPATIYNEEAHHETVAELRAKGHDGAYDAQMGYWIAFSPEQIKSATGNRGTFDAANPDIRFSIRTRADGTKAATLADPDVSAQGFYSALGRTIKALGPRTQKVNPPQLIAFLNKKQGVKPEEIQWSGVVDWMKGQKGSITVGDVTDYLESGGVRLEETVTTDDISKKWLVADDQVTEIYDTEKEAMAAHEVWADGAFDTYVADGFAPTKKDIEYHEEVDDDGEVTGESWSIVYGYDSDQVEGPYETEQEAKDRVQELREEQKQEARDSVTVRPAIREDLEHSDREDEAVRYAEYKMPGGENYSELLLTLPEETTGGQTYESSHWDAPNVLAHVRFDERYDSEGKKTLFVQEVQSDWHQDGRKEGYAQGETVNFQGKEIHRVEAKQLLQQKQKDLRVTGYTVDALEGFTDPMDWQVLDLEQARRDVRALQDEVGQLETAVAGVAEAPFKKSWPDLSMKRMIRWAAEQGFEQVAWTTGQQQADLYSLSQRLDHVAYEQHDGGTYSVQAFAAGTKSAVTDARLSKADPGKIEAVYGKEIARQIVESTTPTGKIEGDDLSVGGAGMAAFYDKMLPNIVNKIGKKAGARVTGATVYTEGGATAAVHALPITPELRDQATSGFALFAVQGTGSQQGQLYPGYGLPRQTAADAIRTRIQDKFLRVKRVQESIRQQGGVLRPQSNTYDAERLFHGRAAERLDRLEEQFLRPIKKIMAKGGLTMKQVDEYLYALHAPERNAYIAKINPKLRAAGTPGSGMATAEAKKIISEWKEGDPAKYVAAQAISKRINQMHRIKLKTLVREGLVPQSEVDAMNAAYQNYVPLKTDTSEDAFSLPGRSSGGGFDTRGKDLDRALGRERPADTPLLYSFEQAESAIVRSEKNRVGLTMLRFVEENPDADLWSIDKVDTISYFNEKDGVVEQAGDPFAREGGDQFIVKRGGKDVRITFAPKKESRKGGINEPDKHGVLLASALKNLGDVEVPVYLRAMHRYMRFQSLVNTSLNPEFVVSNLLRDAQTAAFNLTSAESKKMARRVVADIPESMRAIYGDLRSRDENKTKLADGRLGKVGGKSLQAAGAVARGAIAAPRRAAGLGPRKKKDAPDWAGYFKEFNEVGAKTGWFYQPSLKERARGFELDVLSVNAGMSGASRDHEGKFAKVKAATDKIRTSGPAKAMHDTLQWIDTANSSVENAVRLSAYVSARERGATPEKAAELAKELTINFNRKGTWGNHLNAMYLFYNASIQGSTVVARAIASKRGRRLAAGVVAGSMALDLINRFISGEDEDGENFYDKIPAYIKERNLIMMIPGGEGRYAALPLPYGYNVLHVFGQQSSAAAIGQAVNAGAMDGSTLGYGTPKAEAAAHLARALTGSFNPLGSAPTWMQQLAPTVVVPAVQISENKDFAGRPINPEDFGNITGKPDAFQARKSAPQYARALAEFLNRWTGGDEASRGLVDIKPGTIDHLTKFVAGAAGAFVTRAVDAVGKPIAGEKLEAHQIPFLRKVYGTPSDGVARSRFYEQMGEIKEMSAQLRRYKKLGNSERADEFTRENAAKLALLEDFKKWDKERRELTELYFNATGQEADRLGKKIKTLIALANRAYRQAATPSREPGGRSGR